MSDQKITTFGEIMLRLKTPEHLRIVQTDDFEASYGGAEANVAAALSALGDRAAFVTKLPENPVGEAACGTLRRYGVDTSLVLRGGKRLGIYYFEKGCDIRPTNVVYDREFSALALAEPSEFDWDKILDGTSLFYFSGVTPAISPAIEQAVRDALAVCRARGIAVACDLNYRAKMWSPSAAQTVMRELMKDVTVCFANDEDFEATLGIRAFDGDMSRGIEQMDSYKHGMEETLEQYPNCRVVASVLRSLSTAEDGRWMGLYLRDGVFYESAVHRVRSYEAVGAGDAFAGAMLHALLHDYAPQESIEFGIAASVLKLMIQRDFNLVTEAEIRHVMQAGSTNLQR